MEPELAGGGVPNASSTSSIPLSLLNKEAFLLENDDADFISDDC